MGLLPHSKYMNQPIRQSHPILKIINNALVDLPAPSNLSSWWNFGSLLGLALVTQILTGLFLSIHYTPHTSFAFDSLVHITRDVNYGWILRNIHANGASWFFICLYFHAGRGIYYGSYMYKEVWNIGVIIIIASIATAFVGYVLPWGQISFWGATVITNILSAIPYIGPSIVEWIWGGFAVDNATLNRFFAFHFLLPFIIAALSAIHLLFLHQTGSNKPLGLNSSADKVPFHNYYSTKDLVGFLFFFISLSFITFFFPTILGDPDNFIPANPLSTPLHIMPEWYFLWAYAILRSIPNKLGGVAAIFAAIIILILMPLIHPNTRRGFTFFPLNQVLFWSFITCCLLLTWIGIRPVEAPYDYIGQIFTLAYFIFYFLSPSFMYLWNYIIK